MSGDAMSESRQQEIYDAFDRALKEVARRYEAGELDMSGRYWTDDELKAMAEAEARKDSPDAAA
jgi:uncharacterized protein YajQ (UPF0234 family)